MATKIIYLKEDVTGLSVDNHILGEVRSPPPGRLRLVVPSYGAFFKDSLEVFDDSTGVEYDKSLIIMGDSFPYGNEKSGKDCYTCFLLPEDAPVTIRYNYRGFGGPQSRNAHEIIAWLNERMSAPQATIKFSELTDLPKEWTPEHHLHLFSQIYGMEYIVDELKRLDKMIAVDRTEVLEQQYQSAWVNLGVMEQASYITAEAIVEQAWGEFQDQMSLFNLGVDLLRNYPALGSAGVLVAKPDFVLENAEDERYVDLVGLGSFGKAFVERCVRNITGLGIHDAVEREANRGSFVGALIGETVTIPSPNAAKTKFYFDLSVYPEGWPLTDEMVVTKVIANVNNLGGVFTVINPNTGDQYIGLLFNDTWNNPLVYKKAYYEDMEKVITEAIEDHLAARGAVHSETKEQIGLGKVENLPVWDADEIITGETPQKYVTYAGLLAWTRANMENIKLKRKEDGTVDYDADLMHHARVIINSGACGPKNPPKDQFVSSFCDGTDKWVRLTNGEGGTYDKISELNSDDCNYTKNPEYGAKLSEFCQNNNLLGRYSDGLGGSYTDVLKINSPDCGYVPPPVMGTVLAVFCVGVNQMTRYADGKGGTYDMTSMVDTYICGGKIYSGTGTGGNTPVVVDPKINFVSTHTRITPGTTEILSFYATKFAANSRYTFELMSNLDSEGVNKAIDTGSFVTNSNGEYLWEQTRVDDGIITARGAYKNWIRVLSENVESNKIDRNFVKGDTPTKPDDTTNAGGGEAGSGTTEGQKPPENTQGGQYNPPNGAWPPVPIYDPKLNLSSDRKTLYLGSNETMTATLSGFYADKDYELSFWTQHPKIENGAPFKTLTVTVHTNSRNGAATFNVSNYDDGTVPRGITKDWVEVKLTTGGTVKSDTIERVFADGTDAQGQWRKLSVVTSHDSVYVGTQYTQSIVLTGATPNSQYTFELRRSQYSGEVVENNILIGTFVVTTNGSGTARYDYTSTYDGFSPPERLYMFFARLTGLEQMSTISSVTFVNKPSGQTGRGILTFASSLGTIKPGNTELLTATITNGDANTTANIEYWNQSPSFNGGVPKVSHTGTIRIGSNGIGINELSIYDDNTTPRGEYQSWIQCPGLNLISRKITRNFLTADGQPNTPAPTNLAVSYTTSTNTVSPGVPETHTIRVTGAKPNSIVFADLYITSAALNNGNVPLKTTTRTVSTNSQGSGEDSFSTTDNGSVPPRGVYLCWATVDGVQSPTITRTFVGTPPPEVTYNPKAVYSVNSPTISPGQTDSSTITISGFRPLTSYTLEFWMKGASIFNGNDYRTLSQSVVTDANGNASYTTSTVDTGSAVPRGNYTNWGVVTETGTRTNVVNRSFIGTPAPTAPPYNPTCRYYTSLYTVSAGSTETHTVSIAGMRPNTTYQVAIYIQSPSLFNNAVYNSTTKTLTTDSNGNQSQSWTSTDNGTAVPRGTYANWAIIVETGTSSPVFTRVFV